jgi:type IV pilus assembly protein PilW
MNKRIPSLTQAIQRSKGFSLVELMIAITIALLLTAGIGYLIMNTSSNRKELDRLNRQIENGRYAMQVLTDDLSHAGYFGRLYEIPSPGATLPDPCATSATALYSAVALQIQGYEGTGSSFPSCISNRKTGTDVLVIRRAAAVETDIDDVDDAANAKRMFIQSAALNYIVDLGENSSSFTLKKKNHTDLINPRAYVVRIYWIDTENRLMMRELSATMAATEFSSAIAIADGIENLQLDYGIDSTGPDLDELHAGADPDGTPDTYSVCSTCTTTDWQNVTTIRINLLARNPQVSPGYTDAKQYSLGLAGTVGPFTDGYRRHAYQGLARLNNIGGRREL